jgi:hypothetical protein
MERALVARAGSGGLGTSCLVGTARRLGIDCSCGVLRARCWLTRQRAFPRLDGGASATGRWNVLPSLR